MLVKPLQQPVPLGQQLVAAFAQVEGGGRVWQHRQGGRLAPGKFRGRTAEVSPRSGFQAHHIAAERCMRGIQGQDFPLAVAKFEPEGQHGLDEFLPHGPFPVPGDADHLHGEGAAAAYHVPRFQIVDESPAQRHGIHARMPVELPVFELYQRRGETLRYGVAGREAPLLVGGDAGPQKFPFGRIHHRGINRAPEQVPGQAKQKCDDDCCSQPFPKVGPPAGSGGSFEKFLQRAPHQRATTVAVPAAVQPFT